MTNQPNSQTIWSIPARGGSFWLPCVFACLFALSGIADDVKGTPPELKDLLSSYQSDVHDAVQPIKDRYIDKLKQLLQSELDKGDINAAAVVTKAIKDMEVVSPFIGKWTSHSDGVEVNEFQPGGRWLKVWNGNDHEEGHWTAVSDSIVEVIRSSDKAGLYYRLNAEGHLIRDIGSIDFIKNDE
jgi:hypothetical protein